MTQREEDDDEDSAARLREPVEPALGYWPELSARRQKTRWPPTPERQARDRPENDSDWPEQQWQQLRGRLACWERGPIRRCEKPARHCPAAFRSDRSRRREDRSGSRGIRGPCE